MKSLFKKNRPTDSLQKNPDLPTAKADSNADNSITSYFRDLSRKKTAPPSQTRNADDQLVKKNSIEKKNDNKSLVRTSTFSDSKSIDQNLVKKEESDPQFADAYKLTSPNLLNADVPLKARPSITKKANGENINGGQIQNETILKRRSTRKELSDSTGSLASRTDSQSMLNKSSFTKDSLKSKLEQQRLELSMNFGNSLNSDVPFSKLKLRESFMVSNHKNRNEPDSEKSSILQLSGSTQNKLRGDENTQDFQLLDLETQKIFENDKSRLEVSRERWRSAIQRVKMGLKSKTSMTVKLTDMEIIANAKKQIIEAPQNLVTFSGIVNSSNSKADNQKAKLIYLLRKPFFYRGPEQNNAVELALKNLPAFSRYSKSFRMKLIEKGFLIDLDPYKVVIRQGGAPWSMYFILSGKCQSEKIIVKNGKGYIHRQIISPGEVFGEFGIYHGERRGYTVHTLTQVVAFSVSRECYIQLMKEEIMASKNEAMEVLRSVAAFHSLSNNILENLLSSCRIFNYEPNVSLLKVGDRDNVFFILEGQCRANRLVPFLVKKSTDFGATDPEIIGAYVLGTEPGPDETIVYYNMSIGLLGPGSYFPRISLLRNEGLQYRLQKFDLEKIIILVNSILKHLPKDEPRAEKTNIASIFNQELSEFADDTEDMIAGVDLSVTSIDKLTCLVISKMDLMNVLPEEVIRELTNPDAEGLIGYPMAEIQKNYFDKIQWKGFRNEVVQNVLEKKSTIKRK